MEASLKMSRAKVKLMNQWPYWGSAAVELQYIETTSVPTMATDGKTILWNKEFVDTLNEEQTMAVIIHEVEHVLKQHHLRMGDRDSMKWNIATDHTINTMLAEVGGLSLPDCLCDYQYRNKSAEEVYSLLPDDPEGPGGLMWGIVNPMTNKQGDQLSPAELKDAQMRADEMLCRAVDSAEKSQGFVPGYAEEKLKLIRENKVDWKAQVRTNIFTALGMEDWNPSRINRRMLATHELYVPSIAGRSVRKIVYIFDTSGSMSSNELEQGHAEAAAIKAELLPEEVIVISADADVCKEEVFKEYDDMETLEIKGRGGTQVTPAIEYTTKHHPDCQVAVYFTDLEVDDIPEHQPPYPFIWVSTTDRVAPWGVTIKLGEGENS